MYSSRAVQHCATLDQFPIMNRENLSSSTLDFFLAPIDDLRRDASVTEVMINGPQRNLLERAGRLSLTDRSFGSLDSLPRPFRTWPNTSGRPFDSQHLAMDGRLPDGSRIHVIGEPISRKGICVTIRKSAKQRLRWMNWNRLAPSNPRLAGF